MEKCTLLLNTCDGYSDCWNLFFNALTKNWEGFNFPIMINTEKKQYQYKDLNIKVHNTIGKTTQWGARVRETLNEIQTPYVMPFLEDFVLTEKVKDLGIIENVIQWMDENPNIAVFYLYRHPYAIQKETEFKHFVKLPNKCPFKCTTAIGIWRIDILKKYIKDFESAWDWEDFASIRIGRYKEEMYSLSSEEEEIFVFPYGGMIGAGKWRLEAPAICEKYGEEIDFSIRGFIDPQDSRWTGDVYSVRANLKKDLFTKRYWTEVGKRISLNIRKIRSIIGII